MRPETGLAVVKLYETVVRGGVKGNHQRGEPDPLPGADFEDMRVGAQDPPALPARPEATESIPLHRHFCLMLVR